ncbi:MAG: class I SAM-dependent methyltransferase [Chlamydiota bacterium]
MPLTLLYSVLLLLFTSSFYHGTWRGVDYTSTSFINSRYLTSRIPAKDKRFSTFLLALNLMKASGAKTLVETGTARLGCKNCRGDGCSTIIFGHFAKDHQMEFYSVDISPEAIASSRSAVAPINPDAKLVVDDSIAFLKNFNQPIDFLYLDSYDFEVNDPLPSQLHHLYEIQAAYPCLHEGSTVMIDDCDLPHGGKGKLAIAWLLERGWKILLSQYQVVLAPGNNCF